MGSSPGSMKSPSILQHSLYRAAAYNVLLILIWYTLSTILGIYNKKLLGKEHGLAGKGAFPAPLLMSGIQFFLQFLCAKIVFGTGLMPRARETPVSWPDYWKIVAPNGVISGLDIGFSNKSLVYITMSFYTMCKSTVPIFLLLCAFIWRIEKPSWELGGVVTVICTGLILLVEGEAKFDLLGFVLVMSASAFSGIRFTLTQVSLHGHGNAVIPYNTYTCTGLHLYAVSMGGPLEVLELLTPIMAITSVLLSISWEQLWYVLPGSPYFSSMEHVLITLCLIGAGALLAFLMVWTEYKVIQQTSALTFMIAGTCKEVVTVIVAVIVFGDNFGVVNGVGLGIVITGVVLFNIHKYQRMVHGHIPVCAVGRKGDDAESALELEPLVIAASGAQQPSAGGLTGSNTTLDKQQSEGHRHSNGTDGWPGGGASDSSLGSPEYSSHSHSARDSSARKPDRRGSDRTKEPLLSSTKLED